MSVYKWDASVFFEADKYLNNASDILKNKNTEVLKVTYSSFPSDYKYKKDATEIFNEFDDIVSSVSDLVTFISEAKTNMFAQFPSFEAEYLTAAINSIPTYGPLSEEQQADLLSYQERLKEFYKKECKEYVDKYGYLPEEYHEIYKSVYFQEFEINSTKISNELEQVEDEIKYIDKQMEILRSQGVNAYYEYLRNKGEKFDAFSMSSSKQELLENLSDKKNALQKRNKDLRDESEKNCDLALDNKKYLESLGISFSDTDNVLYEQIGFLKNSIVAEKEYEKKEEEQEDLLWEYKEHLDKEPTKTVRGHGGRDMGTSSEWTAWNKKKEELEGKIKKVSEEVEIYEIEASIRADGVVTLEELEELEKEYSNKYERYGKFGLSDYDKFEREVKTQSPLNYISNLKKTVEVEEYINNRDSALASTSSEKYQNAGKELSKGYDITGKQKMNFEEPHIIGVEAVDGYVFEEHMSQEDIDYYYNCLGYAKMELKYGDAGAIDYAKKQVLDKVKQDVYIKESEIRAKLKIDNGYNIVTRAWGDGQRRFFGGLGDFEQYVRSKIDDSYKIDTTISIDELVSSGLKEDMLNKGNKGAYYVYSAVENISYQSNIQACVAPIAGLGSLASNGFTTAMGAKLMSYSSKAMTTAASNSLMYTHSKSSYYLEGLRQGYAPSLADDYSTVAAGTEVLLEAATDMTPGIGILPTFVGKFAGDVFVEAGGEIATDIINKHWENEFYLKNNDLSLLEEQRDENGKIKYKIKDEYVDTFWITCISSGMNKFQSAVGNTINNISIADNQAILTSHLTSTAGLAMSYKNAINTINNGDPKVLTDALSIMHNTNKTQVFMDLDSETLNSYMSNVSQSDLSNLTINEDSYNILRNKLNSENVAKLNNSEIKVEWNPPQGSLLDGLKKVKQLLSDNLKNSQPIEVLNVDTEQKQSNNSFTQAVNFDAKLINNVAESENLTADTFDYSNKNISVKDTLVDNLNNDLNIPFEDALVDNPNNDLNISFEDALVDNLNNEVNITENSIPVSTESHIENKTYDSYGVKVNGETTYNSVSEYCKSLNLDLIFNENSSSESIKVGDVEVKNISKEDLNYLRSDFELFGITKEKIDNGNLAPNEIVIMLSKLKPFITSPDGISNEVYYVINDISTTNNITEIENNPNKYNELDVINLYNKYFSDAINLIETETTITDDLKNIITNKDFATSSLTDADYEITAQDGFKIGVDSFNLDLFNVESIDSLTLEQKLIFAKFLKTGAVGALSRLTPHQRNVLSYYISENYKSLNKAIDSGNLDAETFAYGMTNAEIIQEMHNIISGCKLEDTRILQRGTTEKEFQGKKLNEIVGTIQVSDRFKSTSKLDYNDIGTQGKVLRYGGDEATLVKIDYICPKGTEVISLDLIAGNVTEQEALLNSNQRIRYDAITMDGDTACVLAVVLPDEVSKDVNIKDLVDSETYDLISSRYNLNESNNNENENSGMSYFKPAGDLDSGMSYFKPAGDLDSEMSSFSNSSDESNNSINNSIVLTKILDNIFATLEAKYGKENAIKVLETYIDTRDEKVITRDNGARSLISTLSIEQISEYMNTVKDKGSKVKEALTSGDSEVIRSVFKESELTELKESLITLSDTELNKVIQNIGLENSHKLYRVLSETDLIKNLDYLNESNLAKVVDMLVWEKNSLELLSMNKEFVNVLATKANIDTLKTVFGTNADSLKYKLSKQLDKNTLTKIVNDGNGVFGGLLEKYPLSDWITNSKDAEKFVPLFLKDGAITPEIFKEFDNIIKKYPLGLRNVFNFEVSTLYERCKFNFFENTNDFDVAKDILLNLNEEDLEIYLNSEKAINVLNKLSVEELRSVIDKIYDLNNVINKLDVNTLKKMSILLNDKNLRKLLIRADYYKALANNNIELDESCYSALDSEYREFFLNNKDLKLKTYGVDQHSTFNALNSGFLNSLSKTLFGSSFSKLVKKYVDMGFSYKDAVKFLERVDGAGACTYASACNEIFTAYRKNPNKFQEDFGFPMYTKDIFGRKSLNTSELLADMYYYMNLSDNGVGGNLYSMTADGKININMDLSRDNIGNNQVYLTKNVLGRNSLALNSYLKSKNSTLSYTSEIIEDMCKNYGKSNADLEYMSNSAIINLKKKLQWEVRDGKKVSFGILNTIQSSYSLTMTSKSGKKVWYNSKGGGHSMFVTKLDENGFYVSSWGEEYYINYNDLNGTAWHFTASTIGGI